MAHPSLLNLLKAHPETLIQVDFLKEIFMIPERLRATISNDLTGTVITESPLYAGKLFLNEAHPQYFYRLETFTRLYHDSDDRKHYQITASVTNIPHDSASSLPLCTPQDPMVLMGGDLANYPDGPDLETTVGIFIANYVFFVYAFNDVIPYLNDIFTTSKMEKRISLPMLQGKIEVSAVKDRYVNTLALIGGSTEIFTPGITEKTISIPPEIHILREQLIAEHHEALEAGDVTVMSTIEKQLIAAYRKHLEGDSSLHFLLKAKYWNVALKKLLLVQGTTEVFGSPGKFTFITNPMGNGWKQEDLPAIFNEVRAGSYARAVETADGGVIAKLILRILQDARIDLDDCGTSHGEKVYGTKHALEDFLWNYVVHDDGTTVRIIEEDFPHYLGKDLIIRTPGYCASPQGYCAKCFGYMFEQLGQKAFAPVANDFARNITTASLKQMHGKSHAVVDVSNLNRYLV